MEPGGTYWVARGGTLIALRVGTQPAAEAGFRIIGAHTDSPNLRIKPSPDLRREGCLQLGVEAYGGLLDYTWLDRDLGLAGEVAVRGDGSGPPVEMRLVRIDTPILRIPSLAIHLNRGLRKEGLKLNRQQHLPPILGLGETGGRGRPDRAADRGGAGADPGALRALLSEALGVRAERVLSWSLALMDVVAPTLGACSALRSGVFFAISRRAAAAARA